MYSIPKPPPKKSQRLPLSMLLLTLTIVLLLASCRQQDEGSLKALGNASSLMEAYPQEALAELAKVNPENLPKYHYYHYQLLTARLNGMRGVNLSEMLESVSNAYAYFENEGDNAKLVLASFTLAKVYEARRENAQAIRHYLNADSYAEKLGYAVPDFCYPTVPYNIASHYKRNGDYQAAVTYLRNALSHVDTLTHPYEQKHRLYSLELMGVSYMYLNQPDSALAYYDQALALATGLRYEDAKRRITCNRIEMLSTLDDVGTAEAKSRALLREYEHTSDTTFLCLTSLSLSKLCAKASCMSEAYAHIEKAESYCSVKDDDLANLIAVYQQYAWLEEHQGNTEKAAKHQETANLLMQLQYQSRRHFEQELLALQQQKDGEGLGENMRQHEQLYLQVWKERTQKDVGITLAALALPLGIFYLAKRYRRKDPFEENVTVNYIIDCYLTHAMHTELADFICRYARSEEEREDMLDKLEMLCLTEDTSMFYSFRKQLFGKDWEQLILSHQELSVCYLVNTQKYKPEAIASMLGIGLAQLRELVDSLEKKLTIRGYRLPVGYRKMLPMLHSHKVIEARLNNMLKVQSQ